MPCQLNTPLHGVAPATTGDTFIITNHFMPDHPPSRHPM